MVTQNRHKLPDPLSRMERKNLDWNRESSGSSACIPSCWKPYPDFRLGNHETRGLDTEFATRTYLETALEALLIRRISNGATSTG